MLRENIIRQSKRYERVSNVINGILSFVTGAVIAYVYMAAIGI